MSIHLDDEGKPSATRAVIFTMVGLTVYLALVDTLTDLVVSQDLWSLLKAVLVVLAGSMATRSSIKHWASKPVYVVEEEGEDIHVDGHGIGYSVEEDADEEVPYEW